MTIILCSLTGLKLQTSLRKLRDVYLVISLISLGLLLRLPSLRLGLWRDEGITYFDVLPTNLGEVVARIIHSESNPPLFYLIMDRWVRWFGSGEVVFKIPAFIFGLLLIPAVYFLGREVSDRRVGLIAAAITAVAPEAIYYSQEARPYTLAALLCCLVVFLYCKAITSTEHQTWYLLWFVICAEMLLYVQYTGLLLIGSLVIITWCLWWHDRSSVKLVPFAIAFAIIFLLFIPWLPIFLSHLQAGTPWTIKEPWLTRAKVFYQNVGYYTLPLPDALKVKPLLKILEIAMSGLVLLVFGLVVRQLLYRTQRTPSRKMLLNISEVVLCMSFVLYSMMLTFFSYSGRYMFPLTPIAWVSYSGWCVALFRYIKHRWSERRIRFSRQLILVLLGLLFIFPNFNYALSLGNIDKSGVRSLATDLQERSLKNTVYLLSPDYLGITFAYYFRQQPVQLHGFPDWDRPEIFSPKGHAEEWQSPTLISDAEKQIQEEANKGSLKLALIQKSGIIPDLGEMRYSRANQLLSQLKQTYPLIAKDSYPGHTESVTLYLFSLTPHE